MMRVSISINCLFVQAQTQFILLTLTSYNEEKYKKRSAVESFTADLFAIIYEIFFESEITVRPCSSRKILISMRFHFSLLICIMIAASLGTFA